MSVLGLLGVVKHKNCQINSICQLLTALSISLTLFPIQICQQYVSRLLLFQVQCDFCIYALCGFNSPNVLHSCRLWQLKRVYNPWIKAIHEIKTLFMSCIDNKNCSLLKKSWSALQAKLPANVYLFVKQLQKRNCYLAKISHLEKLKKWPLTMWV